MNGTRKRNTTPLADDGKRIETARKAVYGALVELGSNARFSQQTSQLLDVYDELTKAARDGDR